NAVIHTQILSVTDTEAPELTGMLPGGDVGNVCKADAPGAPDEVAFAGLYSDNCGTVSATLINTTDTGNDCAWTLTYTFTVSDDCGNSFDVDVVYSGGDDEAPQMIDTLPGGPVGNLCVAD